MSKLQAQFTNYMKIALKNDSIDYFRIQNNINKNNFISLEEIDHLQVSKTLYAGFDTFFEPNINIFDNISDKKMYMAIKSLTDRQQKIFLLYINDYKLYEIANHFNVSEGTIKATISQIKNKLKKHMKG